MMSFGRRTRLMEKPKASSPEDRGKI